jgi:hypothetical protein
VLSEVGLNGCGALVRLPSRIGELEARASVTRPAHLRAVAAAEAPAAEASDEEPKFGAPAPLSAAAVEELAASIAASKVHLDEMVASVRAELAAAKEGIATLGGRDVGTWER